MNKTINRINNGVSRIAFLGASAAIAWAAFAEVITPFIPIIVTVFGSLILGSIVRAIFIRLLNKRLFSTYRYTSTTANKQSARRNTNNTRSETKPNENTNREKINHANSFTPPDPLSIYRNLLGLGPRFTSDELKTAYRNCAAMYHPDRYASSSRQEQQNAEDLMKKVNEAYERLKTAAL